MERIVTELHNICTGYITFARSINTDTLHSMFYPRQFTRGAVKGKQFSGVYRVNTSSISTISNSQHIETVNYNPFCVCTSCKFCAKQNFYITGPLYSAVHPLKYLESKIKFAKDRSFAICEGTYTHTYPHLEKQ